MSFITAIINYSVFNTGINCGRAEGLPCGLTLNSTLAVWPALSEFCQGRMACTDRMPHDTGGICCNDVISFFSVFGIGSRIVSIRIGVYAFNKYVFVLLVYNVVYTRIWLSRHYQWLFGFLRGLLSMY